MLYRAPSLTSLTLAALLSAGCPADTANTTTGSESSSTQASTDAQTTTGGPTTVTPTTGPEPTTDSSTSTGPAVVTETDPSTSTGPAVVTETDPSTDTSTGTTSGTTTTGETDTSTSGTDSMSTDSTSTGGCKPGEIGCACLFGACIVEADCIDGMCVPPDPCQFANDGECDVPDICPPGTDVNDCCATKKNGTCEELQNGGDCPDGSDFYDCGSCPYEDDGACDVPEFCPAGTDEADCCASVQNGTCEEEQFGGMCPNGSDFYDCGTCPYEEDDACDVPQFCPEDSDEVDCCATPEDGTCEELQFGGDCKDGSDFYDCGTCPYEDDGLCDVPVFCPVGSDVNDCG